MHMNIVLTSGQKLDYVWLLNVSMSAIVVCCNKEAFVCKRWSQCWGIKNSLY